MNKRKTNKHVFSKIIIWYCLVGASISTIVSFVALFMGFDPAPTLSAALIFFGGELLYIALRFIFKEKGDNREG